MASAQSPSTAASAASPPSLVPTPCSSTLSIKPETAASPAPLTPASITMKEWVIPPRPKPGRKPATDTPPTKRKAQNRAAQRAFRERRAARVGELEEHIKKIEDEHDEEETELRDHISKLNAELEQFKSEIEWWKAKCSGLERDLEAERNIKETQTQTSKLQHESQTHSEAVPLPRRRSHRHKADRATEQHEASEQEVPLGCGNCSSTSHCECIEQVFNMATMTDPSLNPKRPQSPQTSSSNKRHRSSQEVKPDPDELETDFTTQFTTSKAASTQPPATNSPTSIADPCGFCQNGTPCICAEMAAEISENNPIVPTLSQFTPPPSDGDVLPSTIPPNQPLSNPNSCANGPGTCAQCRSDPNSTLFCKTLAASRSASTSTSGSCAGPASNGSCCQTRSATASNTVKVSSSSLRLSCADTYTTLSRHRNYERASDEMGMWLPKLHALPALAGAGQGDGRSLTQSSAESQRGALRSRPVEVDVDRDRDLDGDTDVRNRPAMDIEAASVMGVLKYFDRRFGKGN